MSGARCAGTDADSAAQSDAERLTRPIHYTRRSGETRDATPSFARCRSARCCSRARRVARGTEVRPPDLSELQLRRHNGGQEGRERRRDSRGADAPSRRRWRMARQAGEAPPELAALRDAVETAAKKGENVEAIAKELGLIEKALTGREYERPKPPPPPKLSRCAPFPQRGGGVRIGGGGGLVIGPGGGGFNAHVRHHLRRHVHRSRRAQGDVTYLLTGSTNGTEAPKIMIQDGEKKIETDDLKKVPEEYRPAAERLLEDGGAAVGRVDREAVKRCTRRREDQKTEAVIGSGLLSFHARCTLFTASSANTARPTRR